MFIVGSRGPLKVGDGYRQQGETVPEAATWPNLLTYLQGGYVVQVADEPPAPPAPEGASAPADPPPAETTTSEPGSDVPPAPPADVDQEAVEAIVTATIAEAKGVIAEETRVPVLAAALAFEQGQPEPRKGMVAALEARLAALADEPPAPPAPEGT